MQRMFPTFTHNAFAARFVITKQGAPSHAVTPDHVGLAQKMAAVQSASAEERERLRAAYKQRLHDMDARLKVRLLKCVSFDCFSWPRALAHGKEAS